MTIRLVICCRCNYDYNGLIFENENFVSAISTGVINFEVFFADFIYFIPKQFRDY